MSRPRVVALVPARSGSKRIPGKNIRRLGDHPLLAYTLAAAESSRVFDDTVVSTDSPAIASVARHYGGQVPFLRPPEYSGDHSPDIDWVTHALNTLAAEGRKWDAFSILRPTSPFRSPETIRRAWKLFHESPNADSLRAVEPCRQHPGKMWVIRADRLLPLLPFATGDLPWHSTPTQALPAVYVQNASLEIAWTRIVTQGGTIAGTSVIPFVSEGREGFDLNSPDDWTLAEEWLRAGGASLPRVSHKPFEEVIA